MFAASSQALRSFLAVVAFAACTTAYPSLVPSRRLDTLSKRSPCIEDVAPKETVTLHYALAPHHPATAIATFMARPNEPIMLLEDIDHLLDDVLCSARADDDGYTIDIPFTTYEAYELAHEAWSGFKSFILLTAHPSCNSHNERGAWRILSMKTDLSSARITLIVEQISMREVGRTFGVRYNHNGAGGWAVEDHFVRRDDHGFDDVLDYGFTTDIAPRYPLFPPNDTIDSSVASSLVQQFTDAEIDLTCINCGMKMNVSIGLDFQINLGDISCVTTTSSCFSWDAAEMNMTVHELSLGAALEIYLGKTISAGTDYKVLSVPVGPALTITDLITLGPTVGLEVSFDLDISSSINFTYGATGQISGGAFASVSLVNSTGHWDPTYTAEGWDQSGVQQIPFRVNGGEFNITSSVAFAPYAEVSFEVLELGAALRLIQNMPQVDANAAIRTQVNRDCVSIGANDFEYFDGAFVVGAGLDLSTVASFVLEKGIFSDDDDVPDHWDLSLWNHDIPLAPTLGYNTSTCFVLSNDLVTPNTTTTTTTPTNSTDDAVDANLPGIPASTGTLFPAASAVPTWDFTKIESYYSANGHLPTNVNYNQMVQATTVPPSISSAVNNVIKASKSGAISVTPGNWAGLLLLSTVLTVLGCT